MKIQNLCTILCLAVFASVLTGCSLGDRLPCAGPEELFVTPTPGEEDIVLTLQNDTCMSICVLLVSPNHCEYMGGVNWVKNHPLRSEESISISIPPGRYAVWVETCAEEYRADENINVRSDTTHSILDDPTKGGPPPCGTSLTIINNSTEPICKLWISNSGSTYDSWNWIGTEYIQPGESLYLTLRSDTYDIRAETCDGTRLRFDGDVQISGHHDWTVPWVP